MTHDRIRIAVTAACAAAVLFILGACEAWNVCQTAISEAAKPLVPGGFGICVEYWLNRYQSLLGALAAVIAAAVAWSTARLQIEKAQGQVDAANNQLIEVRRQTELISAQAAGVRAGELRVMIEATVVAIQVSVSIESALNRSIQNYKKFIDRVDVCDENGIVRESVQVPDLYETDFSPATAANLGQYLSVSIMEVKSLFTELRVITGRFPLAIKQKSRDGHIFYKYDINQSISRCDEIVVRAQIIERFWKSIANEPERICSHIAKIKETFLLVQEFDTIKIRNDIEVVRDMLELQLIDTLNDMIISHIKPEVI